MLSSPSVPHIPTSVSCSSLLLRYVDLLRLASPLAFLGFALDIQQQHQHAAFSISVTAYHISKPMHQNIEGFILYYLEYDTLTNIIGREITPCAPRRVTIMSKEHGSSTTSKVPTPNSCLDMMIRLTHNPGHLQLFQEFNFQPIIKNLATGLVPYSPYLPTLTYLTLPYLLFSLLETLSLLFAAAGLGAACDPSSIGSILREWASRSITLSRNTSPILSYSTINDNQKGLVLSIL